MGSKLVDENMVRSRNRQVPLTTQFQDIEILPAQNPKDHTATTTQSKHSMYKYL
jgi:hypothetical protein